MKILDKVILDQVFESGDSADSKQADRERDFVSTPRQNEHEEHSENPFTQIEAEIVDLFHSHSASLCRYAETLTKDGALVQDGVQEAFLRYFKTRRGGQNVENPRAWLFHVLRNYILDCIRRSCSMRPVELNVAGNLADSAQDVEAKYERNEAFQRAISVLSPRERECMRLRLEGFDYEEIAEVLRVRPGTIGALLARGLKKIRRTGIFLRRH